MNFKGTNKAAHMADGTVILMLERRDNVVLPCFVDAADWPKVRGYRWSVHEKKTALYAETKSNGTKMRLHKLLVPGAEQVDHEDGNGLNNRRSNLREATNSRNNANKKKGAGSSSRFKGVNWQKHTQKWRAEIRVNGVNYSLGYFTSEEDAARAYDAAALQHFGEFAKVNFPAVEELREAA